MIEIQILQPSPRLEVDLVVQTQGTQILVRRGKFRVGSQDFELKEDQEVTLANSLTPISVQGYLALDRFTDEAFLLVDEVPEVNGQYDHYEWNDAGPKALHLLFLCTVPPGAKTLDDVPVKVFLRKKEPVNG